MKGFEDCVDRRIVACESENRHCEASEGRQDHPLKAKTKKELDGHAPKRSLAMTISSKELDGHAPKRSLAMTISSKELDGHAPKRSLAMTISSFLRRKLRVLQSLAMTLVFFTSSIAYASFSVEPLKLNINLDTKFGTVIVTNHEQKQLFFVDIKEGGDESITQDLSYSPSNFVLAPHKIQIIRIMLRPGINYTGKNYILNIRTDEDNPSIAGRPNGFKIPITMSNILPDDLELMKQRDQEEAESRAEGVDNSKSDKFEDLTQIKIAVPVKAVVK